MKTGSTVSGLIACCLALASHAAAAQSYPAQPVRVIVPFAPGGTMDIVGRIVANGLTERFKQNFIVDNRAGAGGVIGTDIVAKSAPNGYSLLAFHSGLAYNATLYSKLPFDTLRDIAPVSQVGTTPSLLLVHPAFKPATVRDVVAAAKAAPGSINFASAGGGSTTHLSMALFENIAGVKLQHVPYKGGSPAMASVISGETQLMIGTMPGSLPHLKSGRLRSLAITSAKRSTILPDMPTVSESGVPGYEYVTWYGVYAPSGTPEPIMTQLNKAIGEVIARTDARDGMQKQGIDAQASSVQEFTRLVRNEVVKWGKVIKQSEIKAD
jgi:tripartite-type tricarboxylate transporter receptor subunit TctC